jgi:2,4-dienoyl-CoA reductase-like NADH-dependent reductase (Old Yellow Enzyme family)
VVLDSKSDLSKFKTWAYSAKEGGAQIWMQLNHPGKQTPKHISSQPVAPSAIPLGSGLKAAFKTPRALTDQEVVEIIAKFALSAKLAKQAGFDGVQIHGAHGYLVSQFLSVKHNQRTDRWGGSIENRSRFVVEIYRAIRLQVGADFPIGIKINSADYMENPIDHEEHFQVLETLENEGIDLIEISGGSYEKPSMMGGGRPKESTRKREAYFLEFAEKARQRIQTTMVVTGGFRSAVAMINALNEGSTDMIGLARPLAIDPDFPNKLLKDSSYRLDLPTPTTGFKKLDRMLMLGITWYEAQIRRIGRGLTPNPKLSPWTVVVEGFLTMGVSAFKKRRT